MTPDVSIDTQMSQYYRECADKIEPKIKNWEKEKQQIKTQKIALVAIAAVAGAIVAATAITACFFPVVLIGIALEISIIGIATACLANKIFREPSNFPFHSEEDEPLTNYVNSRTLNFWEKYGKYKTHHGFFETSIGIPLNIVRNELEEIFKDNSELKQVADKVFDEFFNEHGQDYLIDRSTIDRWKLKCRRFLKTFLNEIASQLEKIKSIYPSKLEELKFIHLRHFYEGLKFVLDDSKLYSGCYKDSKCYRDNKYKVNTKAEDIAKFITYCPNIKEFTLHSKFSKEILDALYQHQKVKKLTIREYFALDQEEGVLDFRKLPTTLKNCSIGFDCCYDLDPKDKKEMMNLWAKSVMTEEKLDGLKNLNRLKSIELENLKLSTPLLERLVNLPKLKTVLLESCQWDPEEKDLFEKHFKFVKKEYSSDVYTRK